MRSLTDRPSGEGYFLSSLKAWDGSRVMGVGEKGGQDFHESVDRQRETKVKLKRDPTSNVT